MKQSIVKRNPTLYPTSSPPWKHTLVRGFVSLSRERQHPKSQSRPVQFPTHPSMATYYTHSCILLFYLMFISYPSETLHLFFLILFRSCLFTVLFYGCFIMYLNSLKYIYSKHFYSVSMACFFSGCFCDATVGAAEKVTWILINCIMEGS